MVVQLAVGAVASTCNIVIHSFTMATIIKVVKAHVNIRKHSIASLSMIMSAVVWVLMVAHALEILIWTIIYRMTGAGPDGSDLLYFAFVNYTTLGYGDIVPVVHWRLLGPVAAMNGILLFGWSTAVIFEVLRRTLIRIDELGNQA